MSLAEARHLKHQFWGTLQAIWGIVDEAGGAKVDPGLKAFEDFMLNIHSLTKMRHKADTDKGLE